MKWHHEEDLALIALAALTASPAFAQVDTSTSSTWNCSPTPATQKLKDG
jgi:hypothetical protein